MRPSELRSNNRLKSFMRGCLSALGVPLAWMGQLCRGVIRPFRSEKRLERGLIIVLPGIESESFLNHSIVWGFADAGWNGAVEIYDWTTSCTLFFPYHLRAWRRNLRQAQLIAERIVRYQEQFPGRPVHLVGHSGGGAIAVLVLEALPDPHRIESAVLLAPALSRGFPLQLALSRVNTGIWNFYSLLDCFFLGLGTIVMGTIDGKYSPSSGMMGFQNPNDQSITEKELYQEKLKQIPFQSGMARCFNFGGHFGCTNRVFVARWLAPILMSESATH